MNLYRDTLIVVVIAIVALGIQTNWLIRDLQSEVSRLQTIVDKMGSGKGVELRELKFTPDNPEVKQGGEVKVMVSGGKAAKATAPKDSKLTATVNADGTKIDITAESAAPTGDVLITVEGDKGGTLKVKVLPK